MAKLVCFFLVFCLLISRYKFVGIVDPLLRELIWPVAGIVFLLFNPILLSNRDGIFFMLSLFWVVFLSVNSTPATLPSKFPQNAKIIFILKIILILGFVLTIADFYFNFDLNITVFSTGTFDARGEMRFSFIRFLREGLLTTSLPGFFIFNQTKKYIYARLSLITMAIDLILAVLNPSKGLVIGIIFYLFNFLFFREIIVRGAQPRPMINQLKLKTKTLKTFAYMLFGVLVSLVLTFYFISVAMAISLNSAVKLIIFRLFDASYDFAFAIIESSSVFFDFNEPPPEFSSILELWIKPILKAFGADYTHDTIPKYIEPILYSRSTFGVSSPNSNLSLELTSIHGLFLGSLLLVLVTAIGFWLRRRYLQASTIDVNFILFMPMIVRGPMFCFQSAQPFFASYIPYFIIVLSISLFYDMLLQLKLFNRNRLTL